MNTCSHCGALLNAVVSITLYDVELQGGQVVSFDGGPTNSEEDLINIANEAGPAIVCQNGHTVDPRA